MNFSDIELKLRYPETFRDPDCLTPPSRSALPVHATSTGSTERRWRKATQFLQAWLF